MTDSKELEPEVEIQLHYSRLIDPVIDESFLVRVSTESVGADQPSGETLTGIVRESRAGEEGAQRRLAAVTRHH